MNHAINFTATFGDEKKVVELSQPNGAGDYWHIMIDNYHWGIIMRRNGEWVYYDKWLETADIQILGEIINKEQNRIYDI